MAVLQTVEDLVTTLSSPDARPCQLDCVDPPLPVATTALTTAALLALLRTPGGALAPYLYNLASFVLSGTPNVWLCILGVPSAGTFTLTYNGQTTAGIAWNATAATVQAALQGLSTVGPGNAIVTGGVSGPYMITLVGPLSQTLLPITGSGAGLTSGTFLLVQTLTGTEGGVPAISGAPSDAIGAIYLPVGPAYTVNVGTDTPAWWVRVL